MKHEGWVNPAKRCWEEGSEDARQVPAGQAVTRGRSGEQNVLGFESRCWSPEEVEKSECA